MIRSMWVSMRMGTKRGLTLGALAAVAPCAGGCSGESSEPTPAQPPNILFITMDDVGIDLQIIEDNLGADCRTG